MAAPCSVEKLLRLVERCPGGPEGVHVHFHIRMADKRVATTLRMANKTDIMAAHGEQNGRYVSRSVCQIPSEFAPQKNRSAQDMPLPVFPLTTMLHTLPKMLHGNKFARR